MEAVQSEIKENTQRTNSEGKEPGLPSTIWSGRKKINILPEQNEEETRTQKNEERLRNLWDNFKSYNI